VRRRILRGGGRSAREKKPGVEKAKGERIRRGKKLIKKPPPNRAKKIREVGQTKTSTSNTPAECREKSENRNSETTSKSRATLERAITVGEELEEKRTKNTGTTIQKTKRKKESYESKKLVPKREEECHQTPRSTNLNDKIGSRKPQPKKGEKDEETKVLMYIWKCRRKNSDLCLLWKTQN